MLRRMPLFRLALRNLLRHPWRSFATALGVALGIAAVLATLSVGDNVRANVASSLEAATGGADLVVAPGTQGRAVFAVAEPLEAARRVENVARVLPVLDYRAEPVRDLGNARRPVIPGVEAGFLLAGRDTSDSEFEVRVLEGTLPQEGSNGIAITETFARARDFELGDEVLFATPFGEAPFTLVGLLDGASGVSSTNAGRVGVVALGDLQRAVRLGGRVSSLEVHLETDAALDEVQGRLEKALGDAYTVTLPAGSGDLATGIVDTIGAGLRVLAATLVALGGFMAYNTFAAATAERTREYALLRTICLTGAQVQRVALFEAALVSLCGVLFGVLLGLGLSLGITRLNALVLGFEFRTLVVPLGNVAVAAGVGVLVALFAGLLPARRASRTPPVVAARLEGDEAEALSGGTRQTALGVLLLVGGALAALAPWDGAWAIFGSALAMGLLFTGVTLTTPALLGPTLVLLRPPLTKLFGTAGSLGASFARRNARRNGVAVGAVVVGVALTLGVGAMVAGINQEIADWVDATVTGDLFVTAAVGFPEGFAEAAAARVPGLDAVSGVGVQTVRFEPGGGERPRTVALILVDPERYNPEGGFGRFQFLQGQGDARAAYEALLEGGSVIAANTLFERFGTERGDAARLRTTEGFKDTPVAGVVVDFTNGGETFIGSLKDSALFGVATPNLFVMTVQAGADPQAVGDALNEAFPELYLDVTSSQSYRTLVLTLTRQIFTTTNGLLVLAVFIAALGVANTLGMNLSTRQHEVALLRALGFTRGGVGRLVSAEGIVVVLLGTLLGALCGLLLSRVITAGADALTGYRVTPVFPWRLALVALLASPVVGLLASLLPARRAARLEPVAALRGE